MPAMSWGVNDEDRRRSTLHPVFWIMAAAVIAPLLADLPLRLRVPVVVFEVLLGTPFGRLFLAAGTVREVGPIAAMSLLMSQEQSSWQELGQR
jgi:hypothetical protein